MARVRALDAVARRRRPAPRRRRAASAAHARQQPPQVRDAELAVAVGEADERVAGRPEAAAQRRAVALVDRVVDDPHHARVRRRERVRERTGGVLAMPSSTAMISNVLGEPGQLLERLRDERLDVLRLVVGGEEVAQRRRARTGRVAGGASGAVVGGQGGLRAHVGGHRAAQRYMEPQPLAAGRQGAVDDAVDRLPGGTPSTGSSR